MRGLDTPVCRKGGNTVGLRNTLRFMILFLVILVLDWYMFYSVY